MTGVQTCALPICLFDAAALLVGCSSLGNRQPGTPNSPIRMAIVPFVGAAADRAGRRKIPLGLITAFMAACIGMKHPKWDERPLLIVQLKPA